MKHLFKHLPIRSFCAFIFLFFMQATGFAQTADSAKVTINEAEVSNWFSENWMWVAGGVLLLIIIFSAAGGSKKKITKTTTLRTDDGTEQRTTTTTIEH